MEAKPSDRTFAGRFMNFSNGALLVLAAGVALTGAAGAAGITQQPPTIDRTTIWIDTVQRGEFVQQVRGAGTLIENDAGELIAQLRIPETQSFELEIGQSATIDMRVAQVAARVAELADEFQGGTLTVGLEITGDLPRNTRPGLSLDGTIDIRRIDDALFVGRPAYGRSNQTMSMFKLLEDETGVREAARVAVEFGPSSVNRILVEGGLQEGDEVILSDMSRYAAFDRVRLR
jgi:hypothetical protein